MTAAIHATAVDEPAVRAALARFVGEIDQRPSSVSAIKVDGKRAYDRVRAGEDVELQGTPGHRARARRARRAPR